MDFAEPLLDTVGVERPLWRRGKVRDVFDLGDRLLIVATDRISAFDVVLPTGIPGKGVVLTQLSSFWFDKLAHVAPHHAISTRIDDYDEDLRRQRPVLEGRSMLVRRTEPLPVECVVRGYLSGSGWKDYTRTGRVCGIELPSGLVESQRLPEPIFTPATKATSGHDENIGFEQMAATVGAERAERLRDLSLTLYTQAATHAESCGIILADTKFEFGVADGGELILIDEALTPDSSRFWPKADYAPGSGQPSFDKQFVRDHLESVGWDKRPPAPELPGEVVSRTRQKYLEAYRRLTGRELG